MKVLIVDDHPKRYDRLIQALDMLGIGRDDVQLVGSTSEARSQIAQARFDLLILDIIVPLWPEQDEAAQHSMDLLFEIREGELPNVPRYVVGITADPEAVSEAMSQFHAWTWSVLPYSPDRDDWVERALNMARFIMDQRASADEAPNQIDLAIICALGKPEQEEILNLDWDWSAPRPINDVVFVRDGHAEVEGRSLSVCVTAVNRMGMVATALRASSLIATLRPRLIAMTGVCAGVRGRARIGDVLFADPAWDFQSGKRIVEDEKSRLSIRPHHLPAPQRVRTLIDLLRDDKNALTKIAADFPGDAPVVSQILPGPVASGSAVLADGEIIQEIKGEQHQELLGVEMEIYGLYAAAHSSHSPQPLFFALKGVCDYADPDKEDGHQQYAAYASASGRQRLTDRYAHRWVPSPTPLPPEDRAPFK
jgi:nucleoside phosphorylase/CheY-like chemotaxis protein